MTQKELAAYVGGVLDGEGCIYLVEQLGKWSKSVAPRFQLRVSITNTSAALLSFLKQRVKAKCYLNRSGRMGDPAGLSRYHANATRDCYRLVWHDNQAVDLLKMAMPYLIVKKAEAELALEFMDRKAQGGYCRGNPMPAEEIEARRGLVQQMKDLKRVPSEVVLKN